MLRAYLFLALLEPKTPPKQLGFCVQKQIDSNRVPDYCIFVSGLSFLPPFYSSLGEAPSRVSEAVLEVFWAPKVPETSRL